MTEYRANVQRRIGVKRRILTDQNAASALKLRQAFDLGVDLEPEARPWRPPTGTLSWDEPLLPEPQQ